MSGMNRTALLAAALIAAPLLTACQGTGLKPVVEDVRPRIVGLDLDGVDVAFDVDVRNPLPVSLTTPRMDWTLGVQGSTLASISDAQTASLPAGRTGTAEIPMRVRYTDLLNVLGSLRGVNEADYSLKGAFTVPVLGAPIRIPFSHAGSLPIVQPPTFSVVDVQSRGFSLSGTGVDVDLDMTNPNVFGVGIDGLGYGLSLGGVELASLTAGTGGEVGAGQTRRLRLSGAVTALSALEGLLSGRSARPREDQAPAAR